MFVIGILFKAKNLMVDGKSGEATDKTALEWKIWDKKDSRMQTTLLIIIS